MTIKGETPMAMPSNGGRLSFNAQVVDPNGKKASHWIGYAYCKDHGDYRSFSFTVDVTDLPNSSNNYGYLPADDYVINIQRNRTSFNKNINFRVKSNDTVVLLEWDNVIEKNQQMYDSNSDVDPSRYLDVTMADIKNISTLTTSQANYIKRVATNRVHAASDYATAKNIYDFVADRFYYDDVAFQTGKNQYCDVYDNVYNLLNNKTSANSKNGKVATVCLGEAGITIALARAEGIPARLVNGHHMGLAAGDYQNWSTEPNVSEIDHWWAELYIDGEWVIVDPTAGSGNHWNSRSDDWDYAGVTNYVSFMPTIDQFSTSYVTYNVFGGGSSSGTTGGGTTTVTKLKAPTLKVSNTASTGKIRLTWSAVSGAQKYEIWYSTSKNGTYTRLISTSGTVLNHTSAKPGTTYYYKAKSIGSTSSANSGFSAVVLRACDYAQPKVTVSNTASTGKIRLTWTSCAGATKYQVYYSTSKNGTYTQLIKTAGTVLNHTSAKPGTTYYYKVRAVGPSASACGAFSAIKLRACDYARPKVTVGSTSKGKPRLTWTSCTGATMYQVYYSTSKNGTYTQLIKTSGTVLNHTSAKSGKAYYYKVRAVGPSASACGAFSPIYVKTSK
ncbi:transglutaminase domain-containing protein [Collinsella tanakaei]|uniref:transglutaminase domain-containing protein n=1 Tax=Collinsella tanakaei TaxID=626935 RepID=UPI0025A4B71D|nr:transglutaminase domain-containing protein [Collinsella tanakaei]